MRLDVINSIDNLKNLRIELGKQILYECGKFKINMIFIYFNCLKIIIFYKYVADNRNTYCAICGSKDFESEASVKCDKCFRWFHYPGCSSHKEEDNSFECDLCILK